MTSYPTAGRSTLSDSDRRMLEASAINAEVAAARGYRTIRHRSEVPDQFAKWQRRLGLLVPTYSPDGKTSGHQLRPNKPIPRRNGNAPKYETPHGARITLDVNPLILEEVRHGDADLWLTEGCKKVDALTSRGLPTVGIIGVWNFAEPGSKSTRPLPCWSHVRLSGRRVVVCYDADARTNPDVQEALRRLVAMLEKMGAAVLVVYLPAANGDGKAGVDDYLASEAGGTVAELRMMAGPYEPVDVGTERMSRDEKLRAGVEDLQARWWDEEWKGRAGHSDRDLALKLIEEAPKSGTIHADGIRVKVSWGKLQVGAKVARKTLAKALARLEERGFLYRDNAGRKADKSGAFVLRAKVDQYGSGGSQATTELRACDPGGLPLRAPRLRWPRPKFTPRRGFASGTRKVRESKPQEPRERVERLGKIRGAVVDALVELGGSCTLAELCAMLHRSRPRDVRRRILPMLEDVGIIETVDDVITLAADWSERLEDARRAGGELEADELAEVDRKRKSRAYHRRNETPQSKPSTAGLAAIKRSHDKRAEHIAEHDEQAAAARAAEIAARGFAKRYVHDRLRALGRIRLGLLQEILHDKGGVPAYALPAAKSLGCTIERLPEHENAEFVFAPREWAAA